MIHSNKLEASLISGISESMKNWICFTNSHHNGHCTQDETIAKFKGTVLGEYIDFEKLEQLNAPKIEEVKVTPSVFNRPILTIREVRQRPVTIELTHEQAGELFSLLDGNKEGHPELHELVYQAMAEDVLNRIMFR